MLAIKSNTYDSRDRLVTTTDAKAQVITNVYDDLDRVTSVKLGSTEITHNYYDSYPAATGGTSESFDQTHAFGVTSLSSIRGMLAAVEQRILDSTVLRTVTYYDNVGQVIQKTSQNHKGNWDRQSSKLDFAGRTLETKLSTLNSLVVETRTSYDRGGRTKAVCQKVSDSNTGTTGAYWEPVGRYSYNGVGEMVSKTLGCNIQKVDYAYNMRGWMTSLNDPNQLSTTSEKDFFGMTLGYDGVGNITSWNYRAAQRNGTYSTTYDITPKDPFSYTFTYDGLSRIKTASLVKSTSTNVFTLGGSDAGAVRYDDNGNILNMKRTFNGTGNTVDNLAYTLTANSNKVASIAETGTNPSTANEFFGTSSSYTYDANGNLLTDSGKGITSIVYNHLNLPKTITKSGQALKYTYAADGTKLRANFGSGKLYDYVAGLVYENNALEFIPTAEGRILPPGKAVNPQLNGSTAAPAGVTNTFYRYEYQINDHLGNLRVACRCGEKSGATTPSDAYAPIVVQENHYDPWGLGLPLNADAEKVGGSPEDRFKFIGRESQKETGWVDLQARFYDPQIGRFFAVDPVTASRENYSTYQYGRNNPIFRSDPNGDCPKCDDYAGQIVIMIGAAVMNAKNSLMTLAYNAGDALGITPTEKGMKWEAVERQVGDSYLTSMEQVPRQGLLRDAGGHLLDGLNTTAVVSPANGSTTGLLTKTVPDAVVATTIAKAGKDAIAGKGAFSVFDWKGYPAGGAKPNGPFKLLQGAEYESARNAANTANATIHKANPQPKGQQIHEVHPVKFGGSPTDMSDKIPLTPAQHAEYTKFLELIDAKS